MNTSAKVRQVLLITLLLNLLVMSIKLILGFWTGSLSLLADALHSVTDSANNILGLIANKIASAPPDRQHPYGHHKFEGIGSLGIAAFLGIAGFEIIQTAINRVSHGTPKIQVSPPELFILLIVLGINIFVAFYERHVGKKIHSQILIADAHHTMSDVWITLIVIAGLIGVWLGYPWLDIILSLPVAVLVFRSAWLVLRTNLPWLVDEIVIPPEKIHALVMQIEGVKNCHSITSRGLLGRQVFIEMHLVVDAPDVETAHAITEAVEACLEAHFSPVTITIHVEPPEYSSHAISDY